MVARIGNNTGTTPGLPWNNLGISCDRWRCVNDGATHVCTEPALRVCILVISWPHRTDRHFFYECKTVSPGCCRGRFGCVFCHTLAPYMLWRRASRAQSCVATARTVPRAWHATCLSKSCAEAWHATCYAA